MFAAMAAAGEVPGSGSARAVTGDAIAMPFPDDSFDAVIAAEVLEHIPADQAAMGEIARVLRPGGLAAVTVPSWLPERICWRLSDDYHNVPGGHLRIFTRPELEAKLSGSGLRVGGHHHAHALHSPYWWLKCAVGVSKDDHPLARAYHRVLVWDIMKKPALTRLADRALNPLIGKSLVVYAAKPAARCRARARHPGRNAPGQGACPGVTAWRRQRLPGCRPARFCRRFPGCSRPSRSLPPAAASKRASSRTAPSAGLTAMSTPGTMSSARWR